MNRRTSGELPTSQEREVITRSTVRVIMIDPDDRVLLFSDSDPGLPELSWWVTPGGGMDPGESEPQTAVREVAEETGCTISETDLLGPIARRHVVHGYSDQVVDIVTETFYGARVDRFDVDIAGHTEDELLTLTAHRWWPRAELGNTDAWLWPGRLPALAARVVTGDLTCEDLGDMEESTLPVD